jgi:L-malate glycosyltransferase
MKTETAAGALRIAMIVPALTNKGPVIVARDLVAGLSGQGHEVVVYHLDKRREITFPCQTSRLTFSKLSELKEFDVVHTHSLRPDLVGWALKHVLHLNAAVVSTLHNYVDEELRLSYGKVTATIAGAVWKFAWRGLDGVAVLSRDAQTYYRTHRVNGEVIYNSRPTHSASPVLDADLLLIRTVRSKYTVLGAHAAVVRRKGLHQVLYALGALHNFAFLLIGDGPEVTRLTDLAATLGVSDRFIRLGSRVNARDYLHLMDVFVMPSYSEGMPLAMLEAASAGVPITCSDIPLFRELFSDDEVGFFQLDDPKSMVEAVLRIHSAASACSRKARLKAAKAYAFSETIQGYTALYRSALARRTQA